MSARLTVTRLLQNPLGHPAPDGAPGDIVRVSDGTRSIYLTPQEFEDSSEQQLRYQLAADGWGRAGSG
ncbi:hypothetical protein [Pseudonocardia sp. MH-G8]|uniref:hypothetical protein n=1 Tax=Pseudonocardia sp. MH-G8 TaxID=1854588 RepID=UPI000BA00257|nr:hypothetical protein [Pseudonocardia sp. MH-G8]OZM81409.1 hypothetical protein CFP66_14765 [Pseudonocardia sp. MH-G8]